MFTKKLGTNQFFEGRYDHYLYLVSFNSQKYTFESTKFSYHFDMVILKKKGLHRRDWIRIRDVVISFPQPDHRKSKFGLHHDIKLNYLYAMTKPKFWFSTIRLSKTNHIFQYFVFSKYTVLIYVFKQLVKLDTNHASFKVRARTRFFKVLLNLVLLLQY